MITIVDYGAGNISSIQNMFRKIGVESVVGNQKTIIEKADKLILPGVGAFDTCAGKLRESGLQQSIQQKVMEEHTPVLGICVGMQLMMEQSEEGVLPGLGWIKGRVNKFNKEKLPADLKIPHMGWADVKLNKASRLFDGMYEDPRFYFVHSYYIEAAEESDVLGWTDYGLRYASIRGRGNVCGVQFHPEKSQENGLTLLRNFADL